MSSRELTRLQPPAMVGGVSTRAADIQMAGERLIEKCGQAIANRWIGSPHGLVYDNGLVFGNGPDDKNRVAWR
jgi:hypothetical protein